MNEEKKHAEKLSVDQVRRLVLKNMTESDKRTQVVYIDQEINPKGKKLVVGRNEYHFEADTIVVFIDNEPRLNWGHDCTYLFFNVHTGEVKEVKEHFPPFLVGGLGTFLLIWKPEGFPAR